MHNAAEETADARRLAGRVHNAAGETADARGSAGRARNAAGRAADASGLAAKRVAPPLSAGYSRAGAHGLADSHR
ncbi:hypothetical protein NYE69_20570 [Paenibacillus sp. FSL R5-0527]|uniref:hypothetical protein n=1 Tax=Paenibacillus sp. FSL R5-0527 TaxID=2975321 RepID=UPI0030F61C11